MVPILPRNGFVLGVDVGDARIGLALASAIARLPRPHLAIVNDDQAMSAIHEVVKTEDIQLVVVGLPRGADGNETAQSQKSRDFAQQLEKSLDISVVFADESLSSKRADEYLKQAKKANISQDAVAACFILQEFFDTIVGSHEI